LTVTSTCMVPQSVFRQDARVRSSAVSRCACRCPQAGDESSLPRPTHSSEADPNSRTSTLCDPRVLRVTRTSSLREQIEMSSRSAGRNPQLRDVADVCKLASHADTRTPRALRSPDRRARRANPMARLIRSAATEQNRQPIGSAAGRSTSHSSEARCTPSRQAGRTPRRSVGSSAGNSAGNLAGNHRSPPTKIMGPEWGRTARHRSAEPVTSRHASCPLASSRGEFHPPALLEPCVSLSTHTAPIT
jgi:hypothetical protein